MAGQSLQAMTSQYLQLFEAAKALNKQPDAALMALLEFHVATGAWKGGQWWLWWHGGGVVLLLSAHASTLLLLLLLLSRCPPDAAAPLPLPPSVATLTRLPALSPSKWLQVR